MIIQEVLHILMRRTAPTLAAALALTIAVPTFAAEPDATVRYTGHTAGLGVGYVSAKGVLRFRGQDYPIHVHGISVAEFGVAHFAVEGDVHNLKSLADFEGKYDTLNAGGAMFVGESGQIAESDAGVRMHLRSTNHGLNLALGIGGVRISFDNPIAY